MTFDYYELDDGTLEIEGYDNEDKAKIVEIPDTIDDGLHFSQSIFPLYFLMKLLKRLYCRKV